MPLQQVTAKAADGPIKIDIGAVLAARLGRGLPKAVVGWLERLICQDGLNDLLDYAWPKRGADFCRAVVDRLGISVDLRNARRIPSGNDARVVFVSNHPLGGLDGMVLIDIITRATGREPFFVVNDLLMAVEPLSDVFVPVNKHGSQNKATSTALDTALASDRPVIIFPAGLCSRRNKGQIADTEWKKMFVRKARQFGRDIVPLHFDGSNSGRFYRIASLRKKLHIPFNLEMVLLPSEVFKNSGSKFTVSVGERIPVATLSSEAGNEALRIRNIVYNLAHDSHSDVSHI